MSHSLARLALLLSSVAACRTPAVQQDTDTSPDAVDTDTNTDVVVDTDVVVEDTDVPPPTCPDPLAPGPEDSLPMPDLAGVHFAARLPFDGWSVAWPGGARRSAWVIARLTAAGPPVWIATGQLALDGQRLPRVSISDGAVLGGLADVVGPVPAASPGRIDGGLAAWDLDGDGVDELFVDDGVYRYRDGAWTFSAFTGLDVGDGCAVRANTLWPVDWEGDGDVDFLTFAGDSAWSCLADVGAVVVLIQDAQGAFAVASGVLHDDVSDPHARLFTGDAGMLVQGAPGAARTYVPIGGPLSDRLGLSDEDLAALGWAGPGFFRANAGSLDAVNPLAPDAPLRRVRDVAAIASRLGIVTTSRPDSDLLADILDALSEGDPAADLTLDDLRVRFDRRMNDEGQGVCFDSLVEFDPHQQLSVRAPMGAAVADLNGDGWMEVLVSTTFEDLLTVLSPDRVNPDRFDEWTLEARVRVPQDHGARSPVLVGDTEHIPWGVVATDLNQDGRVDIVIADGWDDGYWENAAPGGVARGLERVEVYLNTGVVMPGEHVPVFRRATSQIWPDAPEASWLTLCATDLGEDGDVDFLVGVDFDTEDPAHDGAPSGPMVMENESAHNRSLTVTTSRLIPEAWVRVEFDSGRVQLSPALSSTSPQASCAPLVGVGWSAGEAPTAIRLLDRDGVELAAITDPAQLVGGRQVTLRP